MDTKPFEYAGKRSTVTGQLSPVTNRSDMMVARMVRALYEGHPDLGQAVLDEAKYTNANLQHTGRQIWHFTNLSRIVVVAGLDWPLPGVFATKDEILAAWDCFMADDPGFWQYLADVIGGMDQPDAPPEGRLDSELTEQERKDPNSAAAASTVTDSAGPKSTVTSGGARKRRKASSLRTMTGTIS
jgi:hypothetical protein